MLVLTSGMGILYDRTIRPISLYIKQQRIETGLA